MGQFSWITQDTNEAIRESYGCKNVALTTAYMHDDKGNVWEETSYEGYGVFEGKDFFVLLAEMNGFEGELETLRTRGIQLIYGTDGKKIKSPNLTRNKEWSWIDESPEDDPNQGWGVCDEEY